MMDGCNTDLHHQATQLPQKMKLTNTNMRKFLLFLGLVMLITIQESSAQKFAIKSNLLYDATATINLGIEAGLGEKFTFDLSANYNPFQFADNKKWKHWLIQPEIRYWTCRKFGGHFFAAHLLGMQYNAGNIDFATDFLGTPFSQLRDYRFEGLLVGAGVGYGYAWMLNKHWNFEVEACFGVAYTMYNKYECPKCGEQIGSGKHVYYGPTKLAINFVYLF